MKTKLKITDADPIGDIFKNISRKYSNDTTIQDEDEVVAIEDTCCKDDEDATDNKDVALVEVLRVTIDNDNFDEDEVKELADKNECSIGEFSDSSITFEGPSANLTALLKDATFDLADDAIAELLVNAAVVNDSADEDADEDAEAKEDEDTEAKEDEDAESDPAVSADSIFTEEEIRLLKQLAAMAPDLIAAAEKANQEEEAKETAEDPSDELIAGDEEDEDEDEDEEDSQSTTGEMIAEFDDSEDEVEETEETVTTHDSKAAFGSIERRTTAVTDSIDEDLDVIALWNKRYGG